LLSRDKEASPCHGLAQHAPHGRRLLERSVTGKVMTARA